MYSIQTNNIVLCDFSATPKSINRFQKQITNNNNVLEIEKGWCIFHESVMNIKRVLIIQIQCWHFVTQETMYICKQHTYAGNDSWYMHFNIKLIYIIAWKIEMAPIFQFRVNLAIHKYKFLNTEPYCSCMNLVRITRFEKQLLSKSIKFKNHNLLYCHLQYAWKYI